MTQSSPPVESGATRRLEQDNVFRRVRFVGLMRFVVTVSVDPESRRAVLQACLFDSPRPNSDASKVDDMAYCRTH